MEFRTTLINNEEKAITLEFINEWTQFPLSRYNWIEFHPFKVYFEIDRRFANFEIEVYLLGFGIRYVHTYNLKVHEVELRKLLNKVNKKKYGDFNL